MESGILYTYLLLEGKLQGLQCVSTWALRHGVAADVNAVI